MSRGESGSDYPETGCVSYSLAEVTCRFPTRSERVERLGYRLNFYFINYPADVGKLDARSQANDKKLEAGLQEAAE